MSETFSCPINRSAEVYGLFPAVVFPAGTYSYRELNTFVEEIIRYLQDIGAADPRKGRIAVQSGPSVFVLGLIFACWRLGLTVFMAHTRWPPGKIGKTARELDCQILFVDQDNLPSQDPKLRVCLLDERLLPARDTFPKTIEKRYISQDRPAVLLMTSGSTSAPKAACLSYGNLYYNALGSQDVLPVHPEDRWLLSLPLYHVSGISLLLRTFIAGGTVVLPSPGIPLETLLKQEKITHVSLVPSQLVRLLDAAACTSAPWFLKAVLLGGAPAAPGLVRRALKNQIPLYLTYGLTEMGSQVATSPVCEAGEDGDFKAGVLKYRQVKISPDGEVLVRGETLFLGYLKGRELERPFLESGWLPTGDLGSLDSSGCLRIWGRKDNMFICGGENIQPEEIEKALLDTEEVVRAVVVPEGHREYGQVPVAFVVLRDRQNIILPEKFADTLKAALPSYKIPKSYYALPEEFAAEGSKVPRRVLREYLCHKKQALRSIPIAS